MKKFLKLSAVFVALMMVLACVTGCKDEEEESGFDGLWQWYYDDDPNEVEDAGWYIVGTKMYEAEEEEEGSNRWLYYVKEPYNLSINGKTATVSYDEGFSVKLVLQDKNVLWDDVEQTKMKKVKNPTMVPSYK